MKKQKPLIVYGVFSKITLAKPKLAIVPKPEPSPKPEAESQADE